MPNLKITPEQEELKLTRHFRLINLEDAFRKNPNATIINSPGTLFTKDGAETMLRAIYSSTDGDLGFVPTCECGKTKGESRRGLICPDCGTECCSQFVDSLEQKVWINIPDVMGPVLHPIWYWLLALLTRHGNGRGIDNGCVPLIDVLLKPDSAFIGKRKVNVVPDDFAPYILNEGKCRGFRAFYENADYYMDVLLNKYPRTAKKPIAEQLRIMYSMYKDCMFTSKLPILHNSLQPVTDNGATLKYIDESSSFVLEAVMDLAEEERKLNAGIVRRGRTDRKLFEIYDKILKYYDGIIKSMGKKEGDWRKHAGGSRIHFGFRTVVHPHIEALDTDEVLIPWGTMVNCFKLVILNFLVNRFGCDFNQALTIHRRALISYDPMVDECLRLYIDSTPQKKIPILLGRNPKIFGRHSGDRMNAYGA